MVKLLALPDKPSNIAALDSEAPLLMLMVCDAVAKGGDVLPIAQAMGVRKRTLLRWIESDVDRAEQYKYAEQEWADELAKEVIEIADAVDPEAGAAAVPAAKLQCDVRLKLAAKLRPEKYGDSMTLVVNHRIDLLGAISEGLARAKPVLDGRIAEVEDVDAADMAGARTGVASGDLRESLSESRA